MQREVVRLLPPLPGEGEELLMGLAIFAAVVFIVMSIPCVYLWREIREVSRHDKRVYLPLALISIAVLVLWGGALWLFVLGISAKGNC